MTNGIIMIGLVIGMMVVCFMGLAVAVNDNQAKILDNDVAGTQGSTSVASTMIKSSATGTINVMGILILFVAAIIAALFLFAIYAVVAKY